MTDRSNSKNSQVYRNCEDTLSASINILSDFTRHDIKRCYNIQKLDEKVQHRPNYSNLYNEMDIIKNY